MNTIKQKLTSRKLWAATAGFVGLLLTALNVSQGTVQQVAAIIMAGAAVVAYIVGEGLVDAAGVSSTLNASVAGDYQAVATDGKQTANASTPQEVVSGPTKAAE